jgi:hypothetical protein
VIVSVFGLFRQRTCPPEAYASNPIHLLEGHSNRLAPRYLIVLGNSAFKAPITESHSLMNKALQAQLDPVLAIIGEPISRGHTEYVTLF